MVNNKKLERNLNLDLVDLPELIAFDLDYTVWPFYVDCHISGEPFTLNKNNQLTDRSGFVIKPYKSIPTIINFLKLYCPNVKLALASRTPEPVWAKGIIDNLELVCDKDEIDNLANQILQEPKLDVQTEKLPKKFVDYFDSVQLYPGQKQPHFIQIRKDTGIEFETMMFFDDEPRNVKDVGKLGVDTVFVPDVGFTIDLFKQALLKFSKR